MEAKTSPFNTIGKRLPGAHALAVTIQRGIGQHAWAALALACIALAHFLAVDYGNTYGQDDWRHIYTVANGAITDGRPLHLWGVFAAWRLLGARLISPYIVHVVLKIGVALAVYLMVRHLSPDKPVFAFVCASLYLTYMVNDDFLIRSTFVVSHMAFSLLTVLALYFYFVYMSRQRPTHLALGLVFASAAGLSYDGVYPVLIGLPVALFVLERDFSRARVVGFGAWMVVVMLGALRLILPALGVGGETYASDLLDTHNPVTVLARSLHQFDNGLVEPLVTQRARIMSYRLPVMVVVSTVLVALTAIRAKLQGPGGEAGAAPVRSALAWLVAGIGATWLGFAAFLPTRYGRFIERVHTLALIGEAITVGAAIWLASLALRNARYRWLVRYVAIGYVVAYGTTKACQLQDQVAYLGGEWESQAVYLRSLAHLAPGVKEDTLFVYVHYTDALEPPLYQPFGFEYALRYLYDDDADGIWNRIPISYFRDWEASDEGIEVVSRSVIEGTPWARDHLYGWGEMIVVSRDESGRAVVLEALPPELFTQERAELYDPYARIERTFVNRRVREALPPLIGP